MTARITRSPALNTFFSPTAGTSLGRLDIQFDTGLTTATQALILVVDGDEYPFIDADNMTARGRQWENTGLDQTWPAGVPVAVWLGRAALRRHDAGRADVQ